MIRKLHYPVSFMPGLPQAPNGTGPLIHCPICGTDGEMEPFTGNIRESGVCRGCGSWNRQRQIALLLLEVVHKRRGVACESLASEKFPTDLSIYSSEYFGAVHETLKRLPAYQYSRYAGLGYASGETVDGHPHQDLMRTSFEDAQFDVVLTADVMEHIPEPYMAHREIFRILRGEGTHVFTVPCCLNTPLDDQRAAVCTGRVVRFAPPEWHGPPEDWNLVYTVFGLEMVCHLWTLGFMTFVHEIYDAARGIAGPGAIVFEAVKHHDPIARPVPTGVRSLPTV